MVWITITTHNWHHTVKYNRYFEPISSHRS